MTSNTDARTASYKDRLIRLEIERRERVEDIKELMSEAKSAGLLKEELAGIKLAARRYFETKEKREFRESAEAVADALGDFKDSPLGAAAVDRASPSAARAAKKFVDGVKAGDHDVTIQLEGEEPIHIKSDGRTKLRGKLETMVADMRAEGRDASVQFASPS